ncbi:hypothetical protein HDU98_011608 [Podochytrium sp. JEL0797]|nr:hypothetical protein HDU98_011608 [Podochytrium sp. JEL0797]
MLPFLALVISAVALASPCAEAIASPTTQTMGALPALTPAAAQLSTSQSGKYTTALGVTSTQVGGDVASSSATSAVPAPTHASTPPTAPLLTRFLGPILKHVQVNPIFYGDDIDELDISAFYYTVLQSPWYNLLSEYGIGSGTFGHVVSIPSFLPGFKTSLDDIKDIQPYLHNLVKHKILTPTVNSLYPIHLAQGINITYNGWHSCKEFAGYHGSANITDLNIPGVPFLIYTVVPDSRCLSKPGEERDNTYLFASHELAEAVTNPLMNVAMGLIMSEGLAAVPVAAGYVGWLHFDGTIESAEEGEVADMCESLERPVPTTVGVDGVEFAVTKVWSNKANACVSA